MIHLTDYRTAYTERATTLEDVPYPQRVHMIHRTYRGTSTGLVYPPHRLADMVLDPELLVDLRGRPGRTAFIFASGNSHLAGINGKELGSELWYDYRVLPMTLTQVYAGRVSQMCGAQDLVTTDASACASSLKCLMDAQSLIKMYGMDRVVILSFEDPVSNKVLQFFGESGACLTLEGERQTGRAPSAFDPANGGFYVGQGAVLAVLESERVAKASRAALLGAYSASERSTNAIGQRGDGEGFQRAAEGCLELAEASAQDVSVVKSHGTGTESNNASEGAALQRLFGGGALVTSLKPRIGHTMGASGLLETCLLMDEMAATGKVPRIMNKTQADPVYISEDAAPRPGLLMSLAAGMGNIYSAALFDTNTR